MLLKIRHYPEGYDLTLMNAHYRYPRKQDDGKWDDGFIDLIIKDNVSGLKFVETIKNPTYQFYFAKPGVQIETNLLFIDKDKVDMYEVPFKDLEKTIAEMTDNTQFYFDNIKSGNRYQNKTLHTHPKVFMSDVNIEDHYRFRFANTYKNSIIELNKGYFDIEADTINMAGDFPEMGECPINAIAFINDSNNTVYSFLLRNKENPLIEDFEKNLNSGLVDKLRSTIQKAVGGWKNERRYGLDKLQYQFMMYDEEDEIELIRDLFKAIHLLQPDFMMAWNMGFDIPYIIARINKLGYDPVEIMSAVGFEVPEAYYVIDERNKNEFAERGDYAVISCLSVFIDQLIQFASRRKGQSAFTSYGLDAVGSIITGVKKLDYSHITTNIAKFPYLDYELFVFYNIIDTIVQKCIESKVSDIDYVFGKCLANNTRYQKAHRQTVYLANRGCQEFYNNGYIIGNNVNKWNEKPTEKFPGAFVADPVLVSDYSKIKVNDIPINVFNNLDDFDFKSLYPSILREFNMAPNTQIGKVFIPDEIHSEENKFNIDKYTRSTAFMEDFQSGNTLEFVRRWYHAPSFGELYDDIKEYFATVETPDVPIDWYIDTPNGLMMTLFEKIPTNKTKLFEKITEPTPLFEKAIAKINNEVMEKIYNDINTK